MSEFLKAVAQRVVIYDGAMGTNIQYRNPTADDYWGKEGCNELLVLSRPDIIRDIHAAFFGVGCDVVETDTFGSTRIVLAEYGLEDKTAELNIAAARLAREVANEFSTKDKPRFVAGSIGPTTKLPSLGHITWDAMLAAYAGAGRALIEGGVDVLLVETCQDILQAKCALVACFDAMKTDGQARSRAGAGHAGSHRHHAAGHRDRRGADRAGVVRRGRHRPELRHRAEGDERRGSLPERQFDEARFPCCPMPDCRRTRAVTRSTSCTPQELADYHKHFVQDYGVRIVGGCCGTTPEHLKAVVDAVSESHSCGARCEADSGCGQRLHDRCRSTSSPSR